MVKVLQPSSGDDDDDVCPTSSAGALVEHLSLPLKSYFALSEQGPLPSRLADLLLRIESALAAHGEVLGTEFREGLIEALPALRTFALSLAGNVTRADDLVQETLARAWANQGSFRAGSNFKAWLFTILRNQFYSELRKAKREVADSDGLLAAQLTSLADQDDTATLKAVWKQISKLPVSQQQALLLVGAEGFTYEEAAERLGCQVGTVKSRVSRARAQLAGVLGLSSDRQEQISA